MRANHKSRPGRKQPATVCTTVLLYSDRDTVKHNLIKNGVYYISLICLAKALDTVNIIKKTIIMVGLKND